MHFFRSISFALPLLTLCAGLARADVPADSLAVLHERAQVFDSRIHGGSLPRWSEAEDKAAIEKVLDQPAILGHAPYAAKDVHDLLQILKAENKLLQIYTLAGTATPGSPKEARDRLKYQDEIVRASAFLVATSAATLEAIGDFASRIKPEDLTAERRRGIEQGGDGIRQIVLDNNTQLRLPDVSAANKMVVIDALADHAKTIAAYSAADDKKSYADAAKATLPTLPEAGRAKLQTFVDAMATADCKGLCALRGE